MEPKLTLLRYCSSSRSAEAANLCSTSHLISHGGAPQRSTMLTRGAGKSIFNRTLQTRTRPRHTRKPWSVFTHNRSKAWLSNDHTFSCGLSQLQGYFENATICLISFLIPPWLCSFFLLLETSHCFCRGMCSHDARTCAGKLCDAGRSNHCVKKI